MLPAGSTCIQPLPHRQLGLIGRSRKSTRRSARTLGYVTGERQWCGGNYGTSGYWVCSHSGCSKKARESIVDHDCCGGVKHDLAHQYRDQRAR